MLMLLGDIHGDVYVLKTAIANAAARGATALIQVGDFGLFPLHGTAEGFRRVCKESPIPIYFIDGNHDDCTRWTSYTEVTQLWPDALLFYVPRGTVLELDGRTIAFMGGAASIDKNIRLRRGWPWDDKEEISPDDVRRLDDAVQGKVIDVFITHCPPNSVVEEHFDPRNKLQFGVSLDWHDPSQDMIERAWKAMNSPMIYSGHMHRTVVGDTYRILNIDETLEI